MEVRVEEHSNRDQPLILAFGEALWDVFPGEKVFGGAPSNFASHVVHQGGRCDLVSAVGKDVAGADAIAVLKSRGVGTDLVAELAGRDTGEVTVTFPHGSTAPQFEIGTHNQAWDWIPWSPEIEHAVRRAGCLYFGTLAQRAEGSRRTIQRAANLAGELGIPRMLDVNLRVPHVNLATLKESLALADWVKLSESELGACLQAVGRESERGGRDSIESGAESLLEAKGFAVQGVLLTCGERGAWWITREECAYQPAIPVTVVDTVGAGDSFVAAFVTARLGGQDSRTALQSAAEASALVCGGKGGFPFPV